MNTKTVGTAITGLGAICPIGEDIPAILDSLKASQDGFGEIAAFDTQGLKVKYAAEIRDFDPSSHFTPQECQLLDRTAQLAIIAARQATTAAGLDRSVLGAGRVALVMGICAGGVGSRQIPQPGPQAWVDKELAEKYFGTAHYHQTDAVAADLGLTGPCLTVSTACASSTSALASAQTLLDSMDIDAVVVGGADAYSLFTYAGFYALGAMSEQPTSPFSTGIGVTFGEGAGCIVIEREDRAIARGGTVHGLLLGCGNTSDAYHITAPHPSGEGLSRAMRLALADSGIEAVQIDYINAHGTGTQDNDVSETLAIHSLFKNGDAPPVSSSKSYFGHTLGAAGILEFIVSLLGMKENFLPPTLHFEKARAGCDLDYVPNIPRTAKFNTFLSSSAAFGGVNSVALASAPGRSARRPPPKQEILVTGMGMLSPIGAGMEEFLTGLRTQRSGIAPIERFNTAGLGCRHAGLVEQFSPRRLAPTVDTRRMDNLTRFAVITTAMAMDDAGLMGRVSPERIGLHVALTRGPVATQEAFLDSLARNGVEGLSAKYFPSMVLSTLSGQIAQACRIKGASFSFVDGAGAGLWALAHAHHYLGLHPELDAIVVVAADELGSLFYQLYDRLGLLALDSEAPAIYSPQGSGLVLGEGAAALVVERAEHALNRNAEVYGRIVTTALGCDSGTNGCKAPNGARLESLARQALRANDEQVDLIYGLGRGVAQYDMCEVQALSPLLNEKAAKLCCLNGQIGLAEAASGLFAAGAALLSMHHGEAYPALCTAEAPPTLPLVRDQIHHGDFHHALVLGSTDLGNSTVVAFSSMESSS